MKEEIIPIIIVIVITFIVLIVQAANSISEGVSKEELRNDYRVVERSFKNGDLKYIVQKYRWTPYSSFTMGVWEDEKEFNNEKDANDYIDDKCGITYHDTVV